ncbi:MAG: ferritin-like domain-containing protein [Spiroplasma sp.]
MELDHANIMPEVVEKKLNQFLVDHIQLQLDLYNYSFLADDLGFNGFSYWLQVQAQDEVLHQRKIMNYFFQREANFTITSIVLKSDKVRVRSVEEILIWLHNTKSEFLNQTHEIIEIARNAKDYTTVHFLAWFVADFIKEIDELKVLHDEYLIAGGDHYKWDRRQAKKEEPLTLKVIVPFYDSD